MELICGACHGRLLVEVPGTTVACPHCGTHLQAPAAAGSPAVEPSLSLETEDDPAHAADADSDTVNIRLPGDFPTIPQSDAARESFGIGPSVAGDTPPAVQPAAAAPVPSSEAETVPEIPPGVFSFLPGGGQPLASRESAVADAVNAPPADDVEGTGKAVDDPRVTITEDFMARFAARAESGAEEFSGAPAAVAAPMVNSGGPLSEGQPIPLETAPAPETAAAADIMPTPVVHFADATPRRQGVSRLAFVLVLSYASAVTLACAFLLYQRKSNPGTLDLPDLVPPAEITKGRQHVRRWKVLPEDKPVPVANTLKLGETRQYGSLNVTPLRVTRGPVEFSFYKDDARQTKDPEGPVLKLHLRFENVSQDQEFIPLDSVLVYSKDREMFNPHNFVSNVSDRGTRAKRAYLLNLQPGGAWVVKDQHLDEDLAPGQSLEAFVPTSPDETESLSGPLVWRVQFRKGYNRASHRGVTTLIEVLFDSSEIVDEQSDPTDSPSEHPAEQPDSKPDVKQPASKDA